MKKTLLVIFLLHVSLFAYTQKNYTIKKELIPITLENVSLPLREIQNTKPEHTGPRVVRENEMQEKEHAPKIKKNYAGVGADAATQKLYSDTSETTLTILENLEGLDASVDPSDNSIAVGPNHVVQMTNNWDDNSLIRIWDKLGNIILDEVHTDDITGFSDYGDPNIIYDEQADRWVFVLLAYTGNKLILGVSETGDPTGSFYGYSFTPGYGFPDYPKIAVWKDSYILTTNSNDPAIFALDRAALLDGAAIGTIQKWTLDGFGSIGFQAPSPVQQTGSMEPGDDEHAIILRIADEAWSGVDSDYLEITELYVDWVNPDDSYISEPVALSIIPYDSYLCGFGSWNCIPQPSTTKKLDPLSDIIMDKAQYRNFGDHASIVCSTVSNADGGGTAGVRWFELRKNTGGSWYIYQQSTYQPDEHYRWMSSISMNQYGTIGLAYNISSSTVYPGIRMTGRTACDTLNMMTASEEIAQEGTGSNNINRYGDYNGLVTDPVDGTFWFTGNYNPTSSWKTRVIHFSVDTCGYIPVDTTNNDTTEVDTNLLVTDLFISDFTVAPVPANDYLQMFFTAADVGEVFIQLFDETGKLVTEEHTFISAGKNVYALKTRNYTEGNYILKFYAHEQTVMRQVMISH